MDASSFNEYAGTDWLKPGMLVSVNLYGAFNRNIVSLVISEIYIKSGMHLVDVIWQGKRKRIKLQWIKEIHASIRS